MGTSTDYSGGTGGSWTPYKHAMSNFCRHGGGDRANRVLARYVSALGGAGTVAATGRSAAAGSTQRVAAFGTGLATEGLTATLEAFELAHLVGASRFEVLDGLLDALAGDGATLEDQAVLAALCDAFEELYPEEAETYEELEAITLDADGVIEFIEHFVAAWVYNRMLPTMAEKFAHLDSATVARRDAALRQRLVLLVKLELGDRDVLRIDWRADEGAAITNQLIEDIYEDMEDLQ